jgi:acetyl-CoA carboxylase / biotin carboxylase 1
VCGRYDGDGVGWQVDDLKRAIKNREAMLSPLYMQIAHSFADLHDTPGRMLVRWREWMDRWPFCPACVFCTLQAKGCISRVVPWKNARREFYLRLRRRLVEHSFCKRVVKTVPNVAMAQVCGHA